MNDNYINAARVAWTIRGGGGTQTLLAVYKNLSSYTHRHLGCKNFGRESLHSRSGPMNRLLEFPLLNI